MKLINVSSERYKCKQTKWKCIVKIKNYFKDVAYENQSKIFTFSNIDEDLKSVVNGCKGLINSHHI